MIVQLATDVRLIRRTDELVEKIPPPRGRVGHGIHLASLSATPAPICTHFLSKSAGAVQRRADSQNMSKHESAEPLPPIDGRPERRTQHRLRMLIDQMQAGIAENRLDFLVLTGRLNELANEVAELKRQQREPVVARLSNRSPSVSVADRSQRKVGTVQRPTKA